MHPSTPSPPANLPYLVVETAPGGEGFLEDDWLEGALAVGERVRIVLRHDLGDVRKRLSP